MFFIIFYCFSSKVFVIITVRLYIEVDNDKNG